MATVTMIVLGDDVDGAAALERLALAEPGIRRVTIGAGWATIAYDPEQTTVPDLVAAVEHEGTSVGALLPSAAPGTAA